MPGPRTLLTLLFISLVNAPSAVSAASWSSQLEPPRWSLEVTGGGSLPTGVFDADFGYLAGGSASYIFNETFDLGLDMSYSKNSHPCELSHGPRCSKADFSTIGAGPLARFHFPHDRTVDPFLQLGAGPYVVVDQFVLDDPVTGRSSDESQTTSVQFGTKVGLGVLYQTSGQLSLGLVANYSYVVADPKGLVGASSAQYFGVALTAQFALR